MSISSREDESKVLLQSLEHKFSEVYGKFPNEYNIEQQNKLNKLNNLLVQEKSSIRNILESTSVEEDRKVSLLSAVAGNSDKITAHAYWWGFHVVIPEKALKDITTASDITKVVGGLIGVGFGALGIPPVAVIVGAIVIAFGIEGIAIKAVDQGKGVYLSWTWLQIPALALGPEAALPLPTAIL